MCTKLQIIWTCSFRDDFNNFSKSEDLLMVVLFFAMSNFCRGCNKHHSRNIWLQLAVVYNDDDNDNGKKSEWVIVV